MLFGRHTKNPIKIVDKGVVDWKYTTCGYCSTGCSIEVGLNDQGKAINFLTGDIILKINGEAVPPLGPETQPFFDMLKQNMQEGNQLTYTVLRANENKELKEVILAATIKKVERKKKHSLELNPNATAEQMALRDAWLK